MADAKSKLLDSADNEPTDRLLPVAAAFKEQWLKGIPPRIEEYLKRFDKRDAAALLERLLEIEIQCRQANGELPMLEEYQRRLPQFLPIVAKVFGAKIDCDADAPLSRASVSNSDDPSVETHTFHDTTPISQSVTHEVTLNPQFGRYRIIRRLGKGAMGAVFLAEDPQLERAVAIKVPFIPDQDQDMAAVQCRFYEEARAVAAVRHPNICPIFEVGEHDGILYIAMAFIEGPPLSNVLRSEGPIGIEKAVIWCQRIANALAETHRRGVIHRDLKPANIVIDQHGEPIIMDFGLARRLQIGLSSLTAAGTLLGTPAYMAPEQLRNSKTVGPQCDVYSLGVILYEMLTGRRPFSGDVYSMISQMILESPDSPSKLRSEVDAELDRICETAIAREAAERFPTMEDFCEALATYVSEMQTDSCGTLEIRRSTVDISEEVNKETMSDLFDLSTAPPMAVERGDIGLRLLEGPVSLLQTEWCFSPGEEVSIGREDGENVQIVDARVSRRHAILTNQQNRWLYSNLGRNGSFIDGKRIDQFHVEEGHIVQLGKSGPRVQFFLYRED